MHCVAGDGLGILFAAAVTSRLGLPTWADLLAEYAVGFLFGWTIFQALFMRSMAGGDYGRTESAHDIPSRAGIHERGHGR